MKTYKKIKFFISLVCALLMIFSLGNAFALAADGIAVTATTNASVKQGSATYCFVNIDSLESMAALEVAVHFDNTKVKILDVYNSAGCTLYDSSVNTSDIQVSYIFDGKGAASKTRLFYFTYQVLSNAETGNTHFDITIGEACDSALNDMLVMGSRCSFEVAETVTAKSCSVYGNSTVSTAIDGEFTLSWQFSTAQLASGSAIITYDSELFEVLEVTNGDFLADKIVDVNTELTGSIYLSFVGTKYGNGTTVMTAKFKTLKNADESSQIQFKVTELHDLDLNAVSCSEYTTTASVVYDNTYLGDAPKMSVSAVYDDQTQQVTATVLLEEDSFLGAGDFVLAYDPALLTISSYEMGFAPSLYTFNDKESGLLKLYLLSVEDITEAQTVMRVVFDTKQNCNEETTKLDLRGNMITDSLTRPIPLNLVGTDVALGARHVYTSGCDTVCDLCDEVRDNTTSHTPGDLIVDTAPTCSATGLGHKDCTVCGLVAESDIVIAIDPAAHKWETDFNVDIPETCGKEGSKSIHCEYCDTTKDVTVIPATGKHTAGELVTDTAPTCSATGLGHKDCTVCGLVAEKDIVISIDPAAHKWKTEYTIDVPETCGKEGSKSIYCELCNTQKAGSVTVIPATGKHTAGELITDTAPTCSATGLGHKDCTVCGLVAEKGVIIAIDPAAHKWESDFTVDIPETCGKEGSKSIYCELCNTQKAGSVTVIPATGKHTAGDLIVDTAPTCSATGLGHKDCTVCGLVAESDIVIAIDPAAHKWESDFTVDIPETCGKEGSKSIHCEYCDTTKDVTVIPATGKHTAGELITDTAPTCSATGLGHKDCTVCGLVAEKDIVIAIDPAAHKWETDFTVDIPETCGKEGSKSIYCEFCNTQKAGSVTVIPATGKHTAGELITDTAPTCSATGLGHKDCTVCGLVAEKDVIIAIDPAAHKWETDFTVDIPETCGKEGSKSIHCEYCDTTKDVTVIPATGKHTAGELVVDVASTCVAKGSGHKTCTICGQIAESQVEIAIDPEAHTGNNHTENTKAATCTQPGYTGDTVCECGVKIASGEEIAKAPHTAGAWKTVKEPTTSKTGLKEQRCKVCNTLLDSKTIAKKKPAVNFVDVKKSDFFYDAVAWAVAEGVTTGTSPTTFGPDEACTRAQAVTFLWRAAGCPAPKSGNNPFVDVKKSDYFYKAVLWAAGSGVTAGTSKTEFSPEETCTRGQIVTFLWRAQSGKKVSASNPFKDVKKSDFYYNAVLWAVKNGVTTGTSPTTFGPSEDCTRGQIVTFLYRAMV